MHYNAGPKRLTLFQIKIYNANTHLPVFVQTWVHSSFEWFADVPALWLFSHEWS